MLGVPSLQVAVTGPGILAKGPQAAARERSLFVAYGSGDDLYVSQAGDDLAFRPPVRIGNAGKLSIGMRRGPRIVASGSRLVVSAIYGERGGGRDGDLLSWRSEDAGKTWSGPTKVSDEPGAAREGLHAMAAGRDGTIACVWLDLRNKGTEIWVATSRDGGASWSKNARVYRSPEGTVCECCHPSAAFGPDNRLYVMFRNSLGGARDMYLASSRDGGRSFSPALKLGTGSWRLNACPMDGGSLAVDSKGRVVTVWRREDRLFTCRPGSPETEMRPGMQAWVAPAGPSTAFVFQRAGRVYGGRSAGETVDLGEGIDPVATGFGNGAVSFWTDPTGRIWARRL
ncbi:MAG TPA: sialidase family protein [Fimbriimonas sp.]